MSGVLNSQSAGQSVDDKWLSAALDQHSFKSVAADIGKVELRQAHIGWLDLRITQHIMQLGDGDTLKILRNIK